MMKHNPTEYNRGIQLKLEEVKSEHCFPNIIQTIKSSTVSVANMAWMLQNEITNVHYRNIYCKCQATVFFPNSPNDSSFYRIKK